jgi:site-specific DNA-methyltransferase (adenine-specific)/modification methylase
MQEAVINEIYIEENRRTFGNIESLVRSIQEIGLINPITLTADLKLVSGARRIAAYMQLGYDTIPAIIKSYTELEKMVAEIDENLERKELSALRKAKLLTKQKEYYEALHPEASKKSKAKKNLKNQVAENEFISPTTQAYTEKMAEDMRKHQRTVQYMLETGRGLSDEMAEKLVGLPIEDNIGDLRQLARMPDYHKSTCFDMISNRLISTVREYKDVVYKQSIDSAPAEDEPKEGMDFMWSCSLDLGKYEDNIWHLEDRSVDLCLTDPPYAEGLKRNGSEEWDSKAEGKRFDVASFMFQVERVLNDDGQALVFCTDVLLPDYLANLNGLKLKQILHWRKTNRRYKHSTGQYLETIEYILWLVRPESNFITFNERWIDKELCGPTMTAFFESGQTAGGEKLTNEDGGTLHPCQKPYRLMKSLLLTHSNRGDFVIDPFMGSGTTAEACTKWEREFWGCEMNPEYHKKASMRVSLALNSMPLPDLTEEEIWGYEETVIREEVPAEIEAMYRADMTRRLYEMEEREAMAA